jgi:hypothetical protein
MFKLTDLKIKKQIQNDFKSYLVLEIYLTYKGYTRHMNYFITYSSKTFDTINHNDAINVFEKSYLNPCKGKLVDSQLDKLLAGLIDNVDTNLKSIAKALSNTISFALMQSQATLQEVSLKSSKYCLPSHRKGLHKEFYSKFSICNI